MNNNTSPKFLIFTMLILCCIYNTAHSEGHTQQLIQATNFAQEGEESARNKKPILLLISMRGCPYCSQVKREILEPMLISGDYTDKIVFREIVLDPSATLHDFNGAMIKTSKFADRYRIDLTPTLLFLGPTGKELSERIVGINTIELFSYYVDQAIDEAVLKLKSR
jgi:thioredoxin-related protein